MGIFDLGKGKKKTDDWNQARRAEPDVRGRLGLISLANGEKTILPREPQKEYRSNGATIPDWKLILMHRGERGYVGIGHADYVSAIEKLKAFALDSDKTSLLIRELTAEEIKGLVEVQGKRDSYFPYVAELPQEIRDEIEATAKKAMRVFQIDEAADGKTMASEICSAVDQILSTQEIPSAYGDMADVAVALGVLFGQALCTGYGWRWKVFGNSEEQTVFGVVSPEENFCNAPLLYLNRILSGQNIGLDGNNDNTVLLLYNMLENIDQRPEEKKYVPLA